MTFENINGSWKAPEGFSFSGVWPHGAFLQVEFQRICNPSPTTQTTFVTDIYVNDMGREVFRTADSQTHTIEVPEPEPPAREPVSHWSRFQAAFELALLGLQEMVYVATGHKSED